MHKQYYVSIMVVAMDSSAEIGEYVQEVEHFQKMSQGVPEGDTRQQKERCNSVFTFVKRAQPAYDG